MLDKRTLGLSMIVKNEHHVILRCLNSVAPIIDYWTIVDTGSDDGTQDIIKNFFAEKGIPGELIEIEWKDFSTSRNVALQAIEPHVDFGVWIDADEELIIEENFNKQQMLNPEMDSISFKTVYGKVEYTRKNIWKTNRNFKWSGPIHELLTSTDEKQGVVASGLHVIVKPEGSSWGNIREKYLAHAAILEEYTKTDTDTRWIFYTAQSYRDASEYEKSIEWYQKRSEINAGFLEEIYISKFMVAKLSEIIGKDKNYCAAKYQEAHNVDPLRGECIKSLVQMYQRLGEWETAYVFSLYGLRYHNHNPYPHRILFLDTSLYDYEMLELHTLSCFYSNRKEEGSSIYWSMRNQMSKFPVNYFTKEQTDRIIANEQFFPKPSPIATTKHHGKSNYTPPKKKRR